MLTRNTSFSKSFDCNIAFFMMFPVYLKWILECKRNTNSFLKQYWFISIPHILLLNYFYWCIHCSWVQDNQPQCLLWRCQRNQESLLETHNYQQKFQRELVQGNFPRKMMMTTYLKLERKQITCLIVLCECLTH